MKDNKRFIKKKTLSLNTKHPTNIYGIEIDHSIFNGLATAKDIDNRLSSLIDKEQAIQRLSTFNSKGDKRELDDLRSPKHDGSPRQLKRVSLNVKSALKSNIRPKSLSILKFDSQVTHKSQLNEAGSIISQTAYSSVGFNFDNLTEKYGSLFSNQVEDLSEENRQVGLETIKNDKIIRQLCSMISNESGTTNQRIIQK